MQAPCTGTVTSNKKVAIRTGIRALKETFCIMGFTRQT